VAFKLEIVILVHRAVLALIHIQPLNLVLFQSMVSAVLQMDKVLLLNPQMAYVIQAILPQYQAVVRGIGLVMAPAVVSL
jgi:hypothetical protein